MPTMAANVEKESLILSKNKVLSIISFFLWRMREAIMRRKRTESSISIIIMVFELGYGWRQHLLFLP